MAIPFAVPSDEQSEAVLELLLVDLFDILQQIQTLRRVRAQQQIASISPPRVCTTPRRTRSQEEPFDPDRLPNLVANLPFLQATINARTDLDSIIPAVPNLSTWCSSRQRTTSESAYYEESKSVVVINDVESPHQDWTQVGVILRKIADDLQPTTSKEQNSQPSPGQPKAAGRRPEGLLSKVSSPIKSSIWTAVICVVGWHLFRAR